MKFLWSVLESSDNVSANEDVAHAFAKCFSSNEGKRVLNFLASQTKDRFLSADASTNELWFQEGKRALFAQIEHLILKGKKGV
ncbi:MAG: hypothetical protein E7013_00810 [Alphaproteobacteria bacterium]|nr:hypothetical protein [Alphaproteobacteria bacterium]